MVCRSLGRPVLKQGLISTAAALAALVQRHPKRFTSLIAALLLGGGSGAFAVAALAPDASELPVRQVLELVQTLPLQAQAEALDTHSFRLFRSETTRPNDTPEALLRRLGIVDPAAAAFVRADAKARQALLGRNGGRSRQRPTTATNCSP